MFKLSGKGRRSDLLAMAPTLGVVDHVNALEEVLFLRDDLAAIAWAVEHQLQGDLDAPLDAFERYRHRRGSSTFAPGPWRSRPRAVLST